MATPAPACSFNTTLDPGLSVPPLGSPESEESSFGLYNKQGELEFQVNFIDAINKATRDMSRINCPKVVKEFLMKQLRKLKSSKSGGVSAGGGFLASAIDSINDFVDDVNKLVDKTEDKVNRLEKMLCNIIIPFFKTLTSLIEVATMLLPLLYKKILKLKAKLQAALMDFTSTIKSCLISVVAELNTSLDVTIKQKIKPTIDTTLALMRSCPCATEIIAMMFDCRYNDAGDKNTTPEAVYACIKDKFAWMNPSIITDAYNNAVNKYLKQNIISAITFIQNMIEKTLELLLLPIRELMRIYGKILNNKMDMSFMINAVGPFDCLFKYTTEYDGAGVSFKGMSIIDMINSIKSWSSCFEYACSSFTIDSKSWVNEINKTLKLSDSYWRDANIFDLYQSTIGYKVQSYPPSALMIRKLFSNNTGNGKSTFGDVIDVFKQTGPLNGSSITFNNPFAKNPSQKNAVVYSTNNQNEASNLNGLSELNTGIENRLMQMEKTLASDNDAYYVSKFTELTLFETLYMKSDAHNTQIRILSDNQIQVTTTYTSSTVVMQPITVRQVYTEAEPLPTYSIPNDYSKSDADKIDNSTLLSRNTDESMVDYYKRCFTAIA